MSITCSVCGTVNPDGTKFCDGCGVELTQAAAAPVAAAPVAEAVAAPVAPPVELPPLEDVSAAPTPVAAASLPAASLPAAGIPAEPLSTPLEAIPTPAAPVEVSVAEVPVTEVPVTEVPVTEAAPVAPAESPVAEAAPTTPETVSPTAPEAAAVPVSTPTPAPTSTPASTGGEAKLGIKKFGAATGEFIPLNGEKLVVGRFDASSGPVDIDLSGLGGQEHISRRHAELYREGGVWKVRDLGSTNGVYVKRQGEASFSPRLQEPAELHDGDELAFGNLMLSFHQS